MPERIRLSRGRGWRLPNNAVNVARPGKYGNLWIVGTHGTRLQCAARYACLADGFISFSENVDTEVQFALWQRLQRVRQDLGGRDLACWCALDGGACHADVLLVLANPGLPRPAWMTGEIDLGRARIGMDARQFQHLKAQGAVRIGAS